MKTFQGKDNITYELVESSLNRSVEVTVNWSGYTDLKTIGINEIAFKKGHSDYVTIISIKDKNGRLSVVTALPDRLKETVKIFLESTSVHLKKTVKTVCTDIYDGFVKAAFEVFGSRVVVIDRYHVSKLYREPSDQLRIEKMKLLKTQLTQQEYAQLEGMMWILRRKHECLSKEEKTALKLLYTHSPILKEAYQTALKTTHIFNTHSNWKEPEEIIWSVGK